MTGFQRFLVHSLSDEGIVSECFKEGERLVDGIGNVQLRVYEMLKKSLFQGLGQGEHPIKRGRLDAGLPTGVSQVLPGHSRIN